MLRILMIVAVIAIALLRGGTLRNFAALRLRWAPLAIAGLLVQLASFMVVGNIAALGFAVVPLYMLSMLMLIVWVALNWRIPGMALIAAGLLMNLLAVVANGGHMPVSPEAARIAGRYGELVGGDPSVSKHMVAVDGQVRLWLLTDIIPVPKGVPFAPVWSIGDLVLTLGIAVLCYRTIRWPQPAADSPASPNSEMSVERR
jgi:hypothetical protein